MPAEDALEPVIRFVAGVLVDPSIARNRGQLHRPRPREGRRIVDGDAIGEDAGRGAGKPLDETQILSCSPVIGLIREVRGLDDERVAFPKKATAFDARKSSMARASRLT